MGLEVSWPTIRMYRCQDWISSWGRQVQRVSPVTWSMRRDDQIGNSQTCRLPNVCVVPLEFYVSDWDGGNSECISKAGHQRGNETLLFQILNRDITLPGRPPEAASPDREYSIRHGKCEGNGEKEK